MKSFRLFTEEDYRGEHTAPDPEGGAPMHDLTRIYPDDVYSHKGFQYYGQTGHRADSEAFHAAISHRNRPINPVTVYRAVPKDKKVKEINPGDWVANTRAYAQDHGRSVFGATKYKILTKRVHARELFTDGNSIHEWGYHPQPKNEEYHQAMKERAERRAAKEAAKQNG